MLLTEETTPKNEGEPQTTATTSAGEGSQDPPAADPKANGESTGKMFTQEDVNKLVGSTRTDTRAKTQSDLLTELGLEDVDTLKALVTNAKEQKLAQMSELEKANAEAARLKNIEEANNEAGEALLQANKAIEGLLEVRLKELDVPEHLLPLLEGMPLVDRLEYLNENGDKFAKETKKRPETNASGKGGSSTSAEKTANRQRILDRYRISK